MKGNTAVRWNWFFSQMFPIVSHFISTFIAKLDFRWLCWKLMIKVIIVNSKLGSEMPFSGTCIWHLFNRFLSSGTGYIAHIIWKRFFPEFLTESNPTSVLLQIFLTCSHIEISCVSYNLEDNVLSQQKGTFLTHHDIFYQNYSLPMTEVCLISSWGSRELWILLAIVCRQTISKMVSKS